MVVLITDDADTIGDDDGKALDEIELLNSLLGEREVEKSEETEKTQVILIDGLPVAELDVERLGRLLDDVVPEVLTENVDVIEFVLLVVTLNELLVDTVNVEVTQLDTLRD